MTALNTSQPLPLVDNRGDDYSESEYPLEFQPYAYDEDFASEASIPHAHKSQVHYARESDKDSHVFYRRNADGKLFRVLAYRTIPSPNRLIRDAVTGQRTQYRACTADEDFFFSVIVATGEAGNEPCVLFYDNPEQYERHFKTKVSAETNARWIEKLMDARQRAMEKDVQKENVTVVK